MVLEVEPNVYAAYVHLQPGSITVKVGDKVTVGQQLAHLGNSGNSSGPHLHFGLLDQANLFTGRSLPFVLEQFTLVGNVNFETSTGDHLVIAPKSKEVTRAYPLYGGILNFPGN
jgi:murein DD-endopeptidase MepM/ murein hydrolase activator NlpD